jgi:hypothetical protein
LEVVGGGADGGIITISAGDAGDATGQKTGAAGGNIKTVEVANLAEGAILRSVAAGDGGNGSTRGGHGGNVQAVFVLGTDIGDRFGGNFGYDTMGGIFAGLGGAGATPGLNGSVTDIRAESIASIVAGRAGAPDFVESISKIAVGTSNVPVDLLRVEHGDFNMADGGDDDYGTVDPEAYATNNLIGFYSDPGQVDSNKFHWVEVDGDSVFEIGETPLDGLILAKSISLKTFNSTPEAYMTASGPLFDYNNRIS